MPSNCVQRTAGHASSGGSEALTFLETKLPFRELSLIAQADRRSLDPVYTGHRWWARRPAGVMRGLLLAAACPGNMELAEYWRMFASEDTPLSGLRVQDLFVGGGTTLVEAARLGAIPSGTDVDPLAVEIVKHELNPPDPDALSAATLKLLSNLEREVGSLFRKKSKSWTPLHYFWVARVECPECSAVSVLHRNLIIARDSQKDGSARRRAAIVAFCPDCLRVHELDSLARRQLRCCGRRDLLKGNYADQKFTCEACGAYSTHRQLKTGIAPRSLLAVEETSTDEYRRIRQATSFDRVVAVSGREYLRNNLELLKLPNRDFDRNRRESRPLSFGVVKPAELFTDRQLAVFGRAFRWIEQSDYPLSVRRALRLGVSNALATNNKLCGYATDYGRLAPLFSIRSYSLPALAVELNPFHTTAGRGTLRRSLEKVISSCSPTARRHVWSQEAGKPVAKTMRFPRRRMPVGDIICASASDSRFKDLPAANDLCVFDPPYFDYIAYSELSEFYRSWLDQPILGGIPLLPNPSAPVSSFSSQLSQCLSSALCSLKAERPLVFTFHSSSKPAWDAIGLALDSANLLITALWPLKNDSHMGHHSSDGNCEWDVSVVCRRAAECVRIQLTIEISDWVRRASPLIIRDVDRDGLKLAIDMSRSRFGKANSTAGAVPMER